MRPGMRTTSVPGSLDECILDLNFTALPGGGCGLLNFRPVAGYGGRVFGVYVNGARHTQVHVDDNQSARIPLVLPPESGAVSICLEDLGDWRDLTYDPSDGALNVEALCADRISLSWLTSPDIFARGTPPALAQLSAWSLSGVKRFSNCAPLQERATRAQLSVALAINGATRTVSIYSGGSLVAQGSRSGDGAITLAEQNQSGLGGGVTVSAAGGFSADDYSLELRFPHSHEIHYSTSALSFPRAAQQTVLDDGRAIRFHAVTVQLAPGTYNVAVVSVSDTGVKRSTASSQSVVISAPPAAPSGLAYDSGNAAATIIRFNASATPGATYRIYDSAMNAPINMQTPAATHAAGSGSLTQSLAAIAGSPGTRRILVRTVSAGVEEQNAQILRIEYDAAGNVIGARPNAPRIGAVNVSAGRLITVKAVYNSDQQAAAPATAQLFLVAEGSAINYAAQVDEQSWSEDVAGIRVATLSATAPADGFFTIAIKARTAALIQDSGTATERIHVTTAEPPAASSVAVQPARS